MRYLWTWGIISFALVCLTAGPVNSITIHDAAFSPDGEMTGVATDSGLPLLDSQTTEMVYTFPFEGLV